MGLLNQTTHMEADMDITKLSDDTTPERDDFNTTTKLQNFFKEYADNEDNTKTTLQSYITTQSPSVNNKTLRSEDMMDETFKLDFQLADSPVRDIPKENTNTASCADFLKIISVGSNASKEDLEKKSQIQMILNNIDTKNDETANSKVFSGKDFLALFKTTESSKTPIENNYEENEPINLNDMTTLSAVSLDLDTEDRTEMILKQLNSSIATGFLSKMPSAVPANDSSKETKDKTEEKQAYPYPKSSPHCKVKALNLQDLFPKNVISTPPKPSPLKNSQNFRSTAQLNVSDQETPNQTVCKTPEVVDDDVLVDFDSNSTAQTPSFIENFKEINLAKPKSDEAGNPNSESFIGIFNELKTDSTPSNEPPVIPNEESNLAKFKHPNTLDVSNSNLSTKSAKKDKSIPMTASLLRSFSDYCTAYRATPNTSAVKKVILGDDSPTKDDLQQKSLQVTPTKKDSQQDLQEFDHTQSSVLPQIITVTPRRAMPMQQDAKAIKQTEPKPSILSFQESSESAFASVPLNRNQIGDINGKADESPVKTMTPNKQVNEKGKSTVENMVDNKDSPIRKEDTITKSPVKEVVNSEPISPVLPLFGNTPMNRSSASTISKYDTKVSTVPNNKSLLKNTLPGRSPEQIVLNSPQTMDVVDEREEDASPEKETAKTQENRRRTFTLPNKIAQEEKKPVEEIKDRRRTFVINKQINALLDENLEENKAINQTVVLDTPMPTDLSEEAVVNNKIDKNKGNKSTKNDRRLTYVIPPSMQQQQLNNETVVLESHQMGMASTISTVESKFAETHTIIREKMPSLIDSDIKDPKKSDTILASNDKWLDESTTFEQTLVFKLPIASSSMMVSNDYGILTDDDHTENNSSHKGLPNAGKSVESIKAKEINDYRSVVSKAVAEADKLILRRLNAQKELDTTSTNKEDWLTEGVVSKAIAEAERSLIQQLDDSMMDESGDQVGNTSQGQSNIFGKNFVLDFVGCLKKSMYCINI